MGKCRRHIKIILPILLLLMAIASAALCGTHVVAAQSTSQDESRSTENGWVTEEDGTISYYSKGNKVTGLKTISGNRYYFSSEGVLQTGWKTINGKTYYFRKKATSSKRKGAAITGLKTIGDNKYYFNSKGVLQTGWKTINGKTYYFRKKATSSKRKGAMMTGLKTIGSSRYYFNSKGVLQTGWKTISGKTYYFRKKATSSKRKGAAMTGLRTIGSYKYYFNSKGVMQTGWQTINGKSYYFKKAAGSSMRKGAMLSGLQTIGGVTCYFGSGFTQATLEEAVQETLSEMTLKEKIAQMFIVTPEALTGGSTVTKATGTLKKALASYPVGGIIFMGDNLISTSQTKSLLSKTMSYSLSAIGLPIFLAVDEEGGTVARIANNSAFGVTNVGNASDIGATGNTKKAYKAGVTIGTYLSDLGFNLDMAPVADVLTNSENTVVKYRSYGSDPDLVSSMVSNMVSGLEDEGIIACIKHFPGHGATAADSHNGTAYVNKTIKQLKKSELIPFMDQIEEGISMIMVGHISLPKVTGDDTPATLSYEIVTELLREDLGYDGIVITDSMNMDAITDNYTIAEASVQAVNAGVDILLMSGNFKTAYKALYNAVKTGEISEDRIDESVTRILRVKMQLDS